MFPLRRLVLKGEPAESFSGGADIGVIKGKKPARPFEAGVGSGGRGVWNLFRMAAGVRAGLESDMLCSSCRWCCWCCGGCRCRFNFSSKWAADRWARARNLPLGADEDSTLMERVTGDHERAQGTPVERPGLGVHKGRASPSHSGAR